MPQPRAAQQRGKGYAWTVWAPPSAPTALTLTKVSEAAVFDLQRPKLTGSVSQP